jgi:hypothetical protein
MKEWRIGSFNFAKDKGKKPPGGDYGNGKREDKKAEKGSQPKGRCGLIKNRTQGGGTSRKSRG